MGFPIRQNRREGRHSSLVSGVLGKRPATKPATKNAHATAAAIEFNAGLLCFVPSSSDARASARIGVSGITVVEKGRASPERAQIIGHVHIRLQNFTNRPIFYRKANLSISNG
jgi:hypothetical protein